MERYAHGAVVLLSTIALVALLHFGAPFFIRSSSFFDLQRVSTSNQAF